MKTNIDKIIRIILKILPHVNIIISLAFIVLFIIDRYNPSMGFIDYVFTKWLLLILAISSVITSVFNVIFTNKK